MPHAGEDEKAHAHPGRAKDEGASPTKALDEIETREGTHHIDSSKDDLRFEAVVEAGRNEDFCTIIEKKIVGWMRCGITI